MASMMTEVRPACLPLSSHSGGQVLSRHGNKGQQDRHWQGENGDKRRAKVQQEYGDHQ